MTESFTRAERLSSWRRIALHLWSDPRDPTVYGNLEIDMSRALDYLEQVNELAGTIKITVTHLVAKAIAKAIAAHPQANGIVAGRRIYLRDSVDVYCQVATEAGRDLSGVKVTAADRKSIIELAAELSRSVDSVRNATGGSEQTKRALSYVPHSMLGWVLRAVDFLTYNMRLDLSRYGIAFDQFGSAMVSNVGQFGIGHGLAPLVPSTHAPIVLLVGELADRAVARNGEVTVAPCMTVGCTFDHRLIDGYQAGQLARIVKDTLLDPFSALGLPSRSSSADDRFQMGLDGMRNNDPSRSECMDRRSESPRDGVRPVPRARR